MKNVYTVWHLNLSFSSLEVTQRREVINKCYWPILKMAEKEGFKFGLEATASTLEMILDLDPLWIKALKELIADGKVEFIGSGWSQVIGPLVPSLVTQKNIQFGNAAYKSVIGTTPKIYLLNEQVWAPGLIDIYANEGVSALVMEWENPFSANPHWARELRLQPQIGRGINQSIPIIWNHSIAFQKLQKMAHGDISLDEWEDWFAHEIQSPEDIGICIYGGDAETFDFRANRFETEGATESGEWLRIEVAFELAIAQEARFILPSDYLKLYKDEIMDSLVLSNAAMPLPTKKQAKYNPLRWAVGGRDAFRANTICEKILSLLKENGDRVSDQDWRTLLELWGSDFRTHITESRWDSWVITSKELLERFDDVGVFEKIEKQNDFTVSESDGYLTISNKELRCVLNLKRGLAIDSLFFFKISEEPLIGTIRHGELHHIEWNADFYSGEFVVDLPGEHKITDLERVAPVITKNDKGLVITAIIQTKLGPINKSIIFSGSDAPKLTMTYHLDWESIPPCTMRFGDIVLIPTTFERSTLFVETHNGGEQRDRFELESIEVDHGRYWSPLISARNCFGMTEGELVIGDRHKAIQVNINRRLSSMPALLTNARVMESYFTRIQFTARELDDTSANRKIVLGPEGRSFEISIQPFTMP
jgi:hypothetical protein